MVNPIHEPGFYCEGRRDEIVDFVFAEMGPGASEAFEAHLASCPGCSAEVSSLRELVRVIDAVAPATAGAEASVNGGNGSSVSLEEEWALLRRRLRFPEALSRSPELPAPASRMRYWMPAAAAVFLTALLSFFAGWLWRGSTPTVSTARSTLAPGAAEQGDEAPPPVSGASVGNYFDHLEDFTRDTHNCLRRTRMILKEFTKLGEDSDPAFFRRAAGDLLTEVDQYRSIASRMKNRKLAELLDQISGVLGTIATLNPENQGRVIAEVRTTLDLTALLPALELLDAAIERSLESTPNV